MINKSKLEMWVLHDTTDDTIFKDTLADDKFTCCDYARRYHGELWVNKESVRVSKIEISLKDDF